DLLDLHAAFGRGHDRDPTGAAVDQHAEIELPGDVGAFLDIDALDLFALGAGLVGDERHPQHPPGGLAHVFDRFYDLDAAALAAPAGMDLGLHHPDRSAQLLRLLHRLVGGIGDAAARNRDAVFGEQRLRLIFVDVHSARLLTVAARATSGLAP